MRLKIRSSPLLSSRDNVARYVNVIQTRSCIPTVGINLDFPAEGFSSIDPEFQCRFLRASPFLGNYNCTYIRAHVIFTRVRFINSGIGERERERERERDKERKREKELYTGP